MSDWIRFILPNETGKRMDGLSFFMYGFNIRAAPAKS
jgi:hypothetical protein